MRSVAPLAAIAFAGGLVAGACAPPPERELVVGMMEYGFIPSRIEVAAGERVRFVVKNAGRVEHDFTSDQRGRALGVGHVHLRPGETGHVDWTAPATPTEVRIVCTVVGHEGLGMAGTIVVVPRPASSLEPPGGTR
jgi:uncharacterized cupredoxin-like copper-binding protein